MGQPELEALQRVVPGEQVVERGGARTSEAGNDEGALDRPIAIVRVEGPAPLGPKPPLQGTNDHVFDDRDAHGGELALIVEGAQQHTQPLAVTGVTEIVETGRPLGLRVKTLLGFAKRHRSRPFLGISAGRPRRFYG